MLHGGGLTPQQWNNIRALTAIRAEGGGGLLPLLFMLRGWLTPLATRAEGVAYSP